MKYWLKYIEPTGLGRTVRKEWFKSIQARRTFYKSIMAAGCQLVGFGQVA